MSDCGHEKIILQLQEEIRELKLIIEEIRELKLIIEKLTISNKDLQKRLAYYENAHTPHHQEIPLNGKSKRKNVNSQINQDVVG